MREHLFERFFRVHDETEGDIEGTGLGLSIVADTVASLGGRAWAEFPEGESIFAFWARTLLKLTLIREYLQRR